MSEPFVGEIKLFAGNFAISGWALCQGQLLSINQNTVLFALLGTTYGGNGTSTFALPDLRGRVAIHQGTGAGLSSYVIGQAGGSESVTLLQSQMPAHTHAVMADTSPANTISPGSSVIPGTVPHTLYVVPGTSTISAAPMNANSIGSAGGSIPHENRMPGLALNYQIALVGIFPSRS